VAVVVELHLMGILKVQMVVLEEVVLQVVLITLVLQLNLHKVAVQELLDLVIKVVVVIMGILSLQLVEEVVLVHLVVQLLVHQMVVMEVLDYNIISIPQLTTQVVVEVELMVLILEVLEV